ncbi:MAG: hypothetical protein AABN95_25295, partial [Acidobacteriota bacterium]
ARGNDGQYDLHLFTLPQNPSDPVITRGRVRAKSTDCSDLVNNLVNHAMNGNAELRNGDDYADPFMTVGLNLLRQAAAPFDFHPMEGSGFKPELYSGGQNSDLYRHIYGMAGGTLVGDRYVAFGLEIPGGQVRARTGTEFVQRQMAQDRRDALVTPTGATEVRDNLAGITIGNLMSSGIAGSINEGSLRRQIYDILCDRPSKYPSRPNNTVRP